MGGQNTMINFDGQTLFKVKQATSYTVGEVVDSVSPTGRSSGIYPTDTFNAKRPASGGMIICGFSDEAGNGVTDIQCLLRPGDVITVSSVGSNVVTVTVTPVGGVAKTIATIAGVTTTAGVIGFWG